MAGSVGISVAPYSCRSDLYKQPETAETMHFHFSESTSDGPRMTAVVLVVDDNDHLRATLAQILQARGYATVEAATGSEAVAKTSSTRPDLILMDFDLPDMTGADATRIIKNDPGTGMIPIIGCSALSGSEFRHAALEAGMVEYLVKPLSEERIIAKIAQFIVSER